jgi:glutathionylspermidine synthase
MADESLAFERPAKAACEPIIVPPTPLDTVHARSIRRELACRFLLWDAYVGGKPRVGLAPLVLARSLHEKAVRTAETAVRVVSAVTERCFEDAGEMDAYGFHPDVVKLARASYGAGDRASVVRVDLLLDERLEFRACELNADCPGGHNETVALPALSRRRGFARGADVTHFMDRLCDRLCELASLQGPRAAVALVYATAYAEDLQICAFVARALEARGTRTVLAPPTALMRRGEKLYVGPVPIGAVYRYFPTEYMAGEANVSDIACSVERGAVRTMPSFANIFPQSKLAFARAWSIGHALPPLSRALEATLPPTFDVAAVSDDELVHDRSSWVVKRALGRVGDEVFVGSLCDGRDWNEIVRAVRRLRNQGERWIAQHFVRQHLVPTPWGPRYVTLGAYVVDGVFAGYFARLTPESHASHDALVLPVFVEGDA